MLQVFRADVAKVGLDISMLSDVADVFSNVADVIFKCYICYFRII
jgi:hypothetical protein